ncbi:MAG TPA: methyltransferase domain-containing protein [Ktedonobacteraceae bacterium]
MSDAQGPGARKQKNTYVLDAESAAEMARLMRQDRLLTTGMGGVLPEQTDVSGIERVLDLACGPGGWSLEAAYTYSDMKVMGVDISERMITYANAQAQIQQRDNVRFQVMDILKPLTFPAESFDLVNARLVSTFILREQWPRFFQECLRVLRPGGIMRLTEVDLGMSNKPYFEQTFHLLVQVLKRAGMSFSPGGIYHTTVQMLPSLFRQAGLTILGERAHFIEFSAGTAARDSFHANFVMMFQLIEPLLVKMKLATAEEWHALSQKGLAEMYEEDFCAAWMLLTVWGQKPL